MASLLRSVSAGSSKRTFSSTSKALSVLPKAGFPILKSLSEVRAWRQDAFDKKQSVGFVPTMGALHKGHLDLVRQSLKTCDHTVNPTQFAPTEDLATYPRTLEADLSSLSSLPSSISCLFMPTPDVIYPSGYEQDTSKQRGAFVEVAGFAHQMEGGSRPTFFRGVATVVNKLFNIVQTRAQPTKAFFGQKDIQQAVLLRQMVKDLCLPHPASPLDLVISPTTREQDTNLALSSRNAYLSDAERKYAPTLYNALQACAKALQESELDIIPANVVTEQGLSVVAQQAVQATKADVSMRLDYIALNDVYTLEPLTTLKPGQPAIISGALYVGKTRLIDNLVLNTDLNPQQ